MKINMLGTFEESLLKKDVFAVLSKRTPSLLEGMDVKTNNSFEDDMKILSNYPSRNRIPNLFFVKIMRIPSFLFSVAFFTCLGWITMDQHDSIMGIFRFIKMNGPFSFSFNYREIPIWSLGTFLGVFIAVIYNIFIYQRVSRHVVERFKKDYFIFLSNALFRVVNDTEEKTIAILSIKDNTASAIFIENKNEDIIPYAVNIGTIKREDEDNKVFQEYYPLKNKDEYHIELKNDYNKTYEVLNVIRNDNNITIKNKKNDTVATLNIAGEKIIVKNGDDIR